VTTRAAKIAAMRWVRDMLAQRLAVASAEERRGLEVAVRMLEQQLERIVPTP